MIRVGIDVEGMEALEAALEGFTAEMMPLAAKGLKQGLLMVAKDAKLLAPVDKGALRNSIRTEVKEYATFAVGEVSATAEHAVYVEMGTGARGAASGGDGSGMSVTYTPDHPGMAAQPYLYPAYKINKDRVLNAIKRAVRGGM